MQKRRGMEEKMQYNKRIIEWRSKIKGRTEEKTSLWHSAQNELCVNNERQGACRARGDAGMASGAELRRRFTPEESLLSSGRSPAPPQASDCLANNPTLIRRRRRSRGNRWAHAWGVDAETPHTHTHTHTQTKQSQLVDMYLVMCLFGQKSATHTHTCTHTHTIYIALS